MNKKKIFLILIFSIVFILLIIYFLLPKKYIVLTYHDFTINEPENSMQKNIDEFEREMKYLKNHHYKTLTLEDLNCYFDKKCKLPRKSVLITMDDGWINEYKLALPILKKYDLNAVIFYIGSNTYGQNENFISENELKDIKKNYPNIEIASHTFDNHYEESYLKSYDELNNDFSSMKEIIDTKYFAYPYGKYNNNYIKVLKDNGYKLAFGFGPGKEHRKFSNKDNRYAIPRLNMSSSYPYYKFVLRLNLPF